MILRIFNEESENWGIWPSRKGQLFSLGCLFSKKMIYDLPKFRILTSSGHRVLKQILKDLKL